MSNVLLIDKIEVINANAISSPYTIGFPAITAWLGFLHVLERKLKKLGLDDLKFESIGIVCHELDLQVSNEKPYRKLKLFKRSPFSAKENKEKSVSFIPECHCRFIASLVIEYTGFFGDSTELCEKIDILLEHLKLAGGDILFFNKCQRFYIENKSDFRKLMRQLMPGYFIVERRDLMKTAMKPKEEGGEGQDAIEAILDYLTVKCFSEQDDNGEVKWCKYKKVPGWIVPIAIGFHAITEPGTVENQRDPNVLHRFAESVVTLGEFIMPYRIEKLDNILWSYHVDLEKSLYICQQKEPIK